MNVENSAIETPQEFLAHWQGHRGLTRRTIEAFPDKELFSFSIGGMRPFADLVKEMLAIAVPSLKQMVTGEMEPFDEERKGLNTKEGLLQAWDEATEQINIYFPQIKTERFHEMINLFGQYQNSIMSSLNYALENEVHHRGQGYVYLRALGIEPPPFYEH